MAEGVRIEPHGGGVRFRVRVQPRACRAEVAGPHGDALRVRLTAPPVEGAANAQLVALLADRLGVPKSAVTIARGAHGRSKVVEVAGVSPAAVKAALEA